MKIVVVGFKVSEENSVYYKKGIVTDNIMSTQEEIDQRVKELGQLLQNAWLSGSEFVSVRFIK